MAASKKSTYRHGDITLRHAWLAALGVFAVARREAVTAAEIAAEEAAKLNTRFGDLGGDARLIARGGVMTLREKIEPAVAKFAADVEARIAPLMDKFGVPRAPRKTRKTARKTSSRGPAPRKVAERTRARKSR